MADRLRYRFKLTFATGPLANLTKVFPNMATFIAYDVPATVLANVSVANAVLAPIGVSVDVSLA